MKLIIFNIVKVSHLFQVCHIMLLKVASKCETSKKRTENIHLKPVAENEMSSASFHDRYFMSQSS